MFTLRRLAECLGHDASEISVRSLLGDVPPPVSMLDEIGARTLKQLDVNVILVGIDEFTDPGLDRVNGALSHVKSLFEPHGILVRELDRFELSDEDAAAFAHIDDSAESAALRAKFGFPGTAVDAFFVRTFAGATVATSPLLGPCRSGSEPGTGIVVAVESHVTGNAMAHELGHYLGLGGPVLDHDPDPDNLMFATVPNGEELRPDQVALMKRHCMLRTICPPEEDEDGD